MTQAQFDEHFYTALKRQRQLTPNSNFHIKGFAIHKYSSLLQAFAEEFGLIKIEE